MKAGTIKLVSTNKKAIMHYISEQTIEPKTYKEMSKANNPYGENETYIKIIDNLN